MEVSRASPVGLHQMEAILNNTIKPIFYVTTEFPGCKGAAEMAEAVVGGTEELRRSPFIVCYNRRH